MSTISRKHIIALLTEGFVVPIPKKPSPPSLGESRSQAVRRFLSLKRSLRSKGEFNALDSVIQEYFHLKHAEPVADADLDKPVEQVFYLPIHAVKKESSTTTKIRAVYNASAKSSSNTSLNNILQVGPTIHPPLIDVLLRFRLHQIVLTSDVSKMNRAIELEEFDRNLHRFVWRSHPDDQLRDYRMTRVKFGVSASSFAANMSVKQNALDHKLDYLKAADVVETSFYVDDCQTGAESVDEAIDLHQQLVALFAKVVLFYASGILVIPKSWTTLNPSYVMCNPHTRSLSQIITPRPWELNGMLISTISVLLLPP